MHWNLCKVINAVVHCKTLCFSTDYCVQCENQAKDDTVEENVYTWLLSVEYSLGYCIPCHLINAHILIVNIHHFIMLHVRKVLI